MFTVVTDDTESYCIKHDYLIESCSGSQPEEIIFTCKVDEPQGYQMTTSMTIFRESKSNIWNISILFCHFTVSLEILIDYLILKVLCVKMSSMEVDESRMYHALDAMKAKRGTRPHSVRPQESGSL